MRCFVLFTVPMVVIVLVLSSVGKSQEQATGKSKDLTSNQMLMRDKLIQMNRILEGITLDKFDQVEASAKTLKMISRAASWHIADPTPRYDRLSKNFQEETTDLERHAKEQNVEAATLDLVRLNVTCTQCHQHMRDKVVPRK
jgi:hypothetical protein